MTTNLDTLRKTAEAATPGPWEVWKNVHCDPVVVPAGKPWAGITDPKMPFEKIAGLSTAPDDYGRANLEHIATFDPPTVLALLSRLEQAEQQRDSSREACKTLAEVLSNHSEWIVEATDSQDLIGEDGDGDWDVVWDRVMELGEAKRKAEQAVQRVRVELGYIPEDFSARILRALDGDGRG